MQHDFEQSIGYWLTLATQAYHRAVSEELAPHGITYRQSQVFGWLVVEGELTQTELAAKMMIEPPTLVGVLDRMERSHLITRHHCTEDRRKNLIRINPEADAVWDQIMECALRIRRRATEGLSDEQVKSLIGLLRHVLENVSANATLENPA